MINIRYKANGPNDFFFNINNFIFHKKKTTNNVQSTLRITYILLRVDVNIVVIKRFTFIW